MNENGNNFRCWQWFVNNDFDELYQVIQVMITEKVNQILPQLVEEQLRQKFDNLSLNIKATINGRASDDIKKIVSDMIIKEFH